MAGHQRRCVICNKPAVTIRSNIGLCQYCKDNYGDPWPDLNQHKNETPAPENLVFAWKELVAIGGDQLQAALNNSIRNPRL